MNLIKNGDKSIICPFSSFLLQLDLVCNFTLKHHGKGSREQRRVVGRVATSNFFQLMAYWKGVKIVKALHHFSSSDKAYHIAATGMGWGSSYSPMALLLLINNNTHNQLPWHTMDHLSTTAYQCGTAQLLKIAELAHQHSLPPFFPPHLLFYFSFGNKAVNGSGHPLLRWLSHGLMDRLTLHVCVGVLY